MIESYVTISPHFHSSEFRCKCGCRKIYIDKNLVNNLERVFDKLNASKCIISSGYRCSKHDKAVGGNGYGQHTKGKASDCIYYDKNGCIIPSKIVICVAYDLGLFKGMAKINNNYSHLDIRSSGVYRGDETIGNSSYWTNPYSYFGVTKEDVNKYTNEHSYLANYNYKGVSIVEGLKQIGADSSYSYRSRLASVNGITNYKGTATQNTNLLNLLKTGKLIKA